MTIPLRLLEALGGNTPLGPEPWKRSFSPPGAHPRVPQKRRRAFVVYEPGACPDLRSNLEHIWACSERGRHHAMHGTTRSCIGEVQGRRRTGEGCTERLVILAQC